MKVGGAMVAAGGIVRPGGVQFTRTGFSEVPYPWTALCRVRRGTGWKIANRIVVTAAHCVTSVAYANVTTLGGSIVQGEVVRFIDAPSVGTADDIALLLLDEEISGLSLEPTLYPSAYHGNVTVAGIPDAELDEIFQDTGPVRGRQNGLLYYSVNTISGHSGSPVLLNPNTNECVGIHLAPGGISIGGASSNQVNRGLLFEQKHLDFISKESLGL